MRASLFTASLALVIQSVASAPPKDYGSMQEAIVSSEMTSVPPEMVDNTPAEYLYKRQKEDE